MKQPRYTSTTRGFARTSSLLQSRIRSASEGRGFAQSRVLTHWAEIVGAQIAQTTRPVSITYARNGLGATLTLLTTGAMAPMVEMQKEQIREKVNACYGYRAIQKVRITQTAPTGFHEGRAAFEDAPKAETTPDPRAQEDARTLASDVASDDLRLALARLGEHVLSKRKT